MLGAHLVQLMAEQDWHQCGDPGMRVPWVPALIHKHPERPHPMRKPRRERRLTFESMEDRMLLAAFEVVSADPDWEVLAPPYDDIARNHIESFLDGAPWGYAN